MQKTYSTRLDFDPIGLALGGSLLSKRYLKLTLVVLSFSWLSLAQAEDFVPGQVIVKLRSGKGKATAVNSSGFHSKMSQKGSSLMKSFDRLNVHHYKLADGADVRQAVRDLQADPDVEYVEPNYYLHKSQVDPSTLNQTFSIAEAQAALGASAQGTFSQNFAAVKVTESWSALSPATLITPVVAVIDTGVDFNHNVFTAAGAIWTNPGESGVDANGHNKANNGIDDDGNGFVDDVRGWNFHDGTNSPLDDDSHGTHVAGIVLGVSQDIFASTLASAKIRIMPLKFLGGDGSGSTSDAISAIYYAVNNGANVINNSWGGANYSQSLHDALTYAYSHKVFIAVAAGNYTNNNDTSAMYPANYPVPSLMSVAATTDFDNLASFSNYGKSSVPVGAPGVGIFSTTPGNSFRYMSGTSMASPFVAGMAAMIYREAPNLTGYQIKNLIMNTVNPISSLSTKVFTSGRVNQSNAIAEAKNELSVQSIQPNYVADPPAGYRAPAATETKGGCGTVSTIVSSQGSGSQGLGALAVSLAFALPLILWSVLRTRERNMKGRRQHERFVMKSDIKLKVGDREMSGQVRTISEGGLSFCADSMLEKGGIVTMTISSPTGDQQIQVQGHVVWSEANQAYGVKFDEAKEGVAAAIRNWTANLVRAR